MTGSNGGHGACTIPKQSATIWKVSFHMSLTFDFHVDQTRRTACVENCAPEEGTGSDPSLVSQ